MNTNKMNSKTKFTVEDLQEWYDEKKITEIESAYIYCAILESDTGYITMEEVYNLIDVANE